MWLALSLACAPADTDVELVHGPQIEIGREIVDFGSVYANTTSVQWLKLLNVGDEDLEIGASTFLGGGEYFRAGDLTGAVIEPGKDKGLKLSFDAPDETLQLHTVVTIASNDPDGELWVDVTGTPLANAVRMDSSVLDFGQSGLSCTSLLEATVRNTGETPVTVASLVTEGPGFAADAREDLNGDLPWTLEPAESKTFDVTFAPTTIALFDGSVALNGPDGLPIVQQYMVGQGSDHSHYTDRFTVDGGQLDIIIPVQLPHGTAPLATDVDPLLETFPEFLDVLDGRGVEYQIAILVPDTGCAAGSEPFLDYTMNRTQQMKIANDMLDVGPEVGITHGLNLATYAVSDANLNGCNETLFRKEAKLAVFGYTYIGYNHPRTGWWDTVRTVEKTKSDPDDVTYYGILEDLWELKGPVCGYGSHSMWADAVEYNGGLWYPICDDDVPARILEIAEVMGGAQTSFPLTHPPAPDTIKVTIEGAATSDWTFDAKTNSVIMTNTTYGREIAVDYDGASRCE